MLRRLGQAFNWLICDSKFGIFKAGFCAGFCIPLAITGIDVGTGWLEFFFGIIGAYLYWSD